MQQSESATYIHISPLLGTSLPFPPNPTTPGHHRALSWASWALYPIHTFLSSFPSDPMTNLVPQLTVAWILTAWVLTSFPKMRNVYMSIPTSQVVPLPHSPPCPHTCSLSVYPFLPRRWVYCTVFLVSPFTLWFWMHFQLFLSVAILGLLLLSLFLGHSKSLHISQGYSWLLLVKTVTTHPAVHVSLFHMPSGASRPETTF